MKANSIVLSTSYWLEGKFLSISPPAELCYIRCLCACTHNGTQTLTESLVSYFCADILRHENDQYGVSELLDELMENGLFGRVSDDEFEVLV